MKIISPKVHGIIDYLVVIFLGLSPIVLGMSPMVGQFTYILCGVHLLLTLLTNFNAGMFKLIPLPIHGFIELIVGIALIVLAYTLFKNDSLGKIYYTSFGAAVLLVYLLTDYKVPKKE